MKKQSVLQSIRQDYARCFSIQSSAYQKALQPFKRFWYVHPEEKRPEKKKNSVSACVEYVSICMMQKKCSNSLETQCVQILLICAGADTCPSVFLGSCLFRKPGTRGRTADWWYYIISELKFCQSFVLRGQNNNGRGAVNNTVPRHVGGSWPAEEIKLHEGESAGSSLHDALPACLLHNLPVRQPKPNKEIWHFTLWPWWIMPRVTYFIHR